MVPEEFAIWFFGFLATEKLPFPLRSLWINEKFSNEIGEIMSCGQSLLWVQVKKSSKKCQEVQEVQTQSLRDKGRMTRRRAQRCCSTF